MNKNMTALVSLFVRVYHAKNSNLRVYEDTCADKLLSKEEYEGISKSMRDGIGYFNPNYKGKDALKWIVNNTLDPSVLARETFNEYHLFNEIKLGLKQYVIFASGYETSGFKVNSRVKVFELDREEMINDKLDRIRKSKLNTENITYIGTDFNGDWLKDLMKNNYNPNEKTFCSMLGISYYLDKDVFKKMIMELGEVIPKGSVILFDYPNNYRIKENKIRELANSANEEMKSVYAYEDMIDIEKNTDLLIYEHLNYQDIDKTYFYNYNTINPNDRLVAPKNVSYILFVKK